MLVRLCKENSTNQIRVHAGGDFIQGIGSSDDTVWLKSAGWRPRESADVEYEKYPHRCHHHGAHSLVFNGRKAHWFMSIGSCGKS